MLRSAFIVLLLASSPAFAGQASAVIHVGITITGNPAQTPTKTKASRSGQQAVAGSVSGARPAARRSAPTRPRPPQ